MTKTNQKQDDDWTLIILDPEGEEIATLEVETEVIHALIAEGLLGVLRRAAREWDR